MAIRSHPSSDKATRADLDHTALTLLMNTKPAEHRRTIHERVQYVHQARRFPSFPICICSGGLGFSTFLCSASASDLQLFSLESIHERQPYSPILCRGEHGPLTPVC